MEKGHRIFRFVDLFCSSTGFVGKAMLDAFC
jgi:hypothetical protein